MGSPAKPRKGTPKKEKKQKQPRTVPKKETLSTDEKDVEEKGQVSSGQPTEKKVHGGEEEPTPSGTLEVASGDIPKTTSSSSRARRRRQRKEKERLALGSSTPEQPHSQPPSREDTTMSSSPEHSLRQFVKKEDSSSPEHSLRHFVKKEEDSCSTEHPLRHFVKKEDSSSPEQPPRHFVKKEASSSPEQPPRPVVKKEKESCSTEHPLKHFLKKDDSSSPEQPPRHLVKKEEESCSTEHPLKRFFKKDDSSSPEPSCSHFADRDAPSVSSSRRHRPRKDDSPRRYILDSDEASWFEVPEYLLDPETYLPPPQQPPPKAAQGRGDEERSSSPGEACALAPEEYLMIAEQERLLKQFAASAKPSTSYGSPKPSTSYGSPRPSTSYAYEKDVESSSSPEQVPRYREERERRPKRGRRESLRTVMARRKREMAQAPEEAPSEFALLDPYANSTASNYITQGRTGVVFDAEILKHKCEWDAKHPEEPQRLSTIMEKCDKRGFLDQCAQIPNHLRTDLYERILTKHSPEHYEKLKSVCQNTNQTELEEEAAQYDSIYFNKFTFDAACRSLSSTLNLVLAVAKRDIMNGMAFVRPPGHHAMFDEFNGYCFFNNVAIAAEACIKDGLSKRILIVDIDVHHGQGTQQMFYNRKDVLYFSIHRYEHGHFWPNLAESNFNYIGKGEGLGYNINVPLNVTGLCDSDYLTIIFSILLPVAYEFNPDLIIVSAGYDAAIGCPEGKMNITPGFYSHLISLLHGLAKGQIAVVLEGGYFIPTLSESACMTLKSLIGGPCPLLEPLRGAHPAVVDIIRSVRRSLYGKWNCFNVCELVPREGAPEEELVYKIQFMGEAEKPPYMTRNSYPENSVPDQLFFLRLNKALRERYRASVHKPVTYVYDESMLRHTPQKGDIERPERPERLTSIFNMFHEFGIDRRLVRHKIVKRDWSAYSPHILHYMDGVNIGLVQSKDVYVNEYTHDCVHTAVCGLLTVVDSIMNGTARSGVAIIRPPGHHAEHNRPLGFCFVNNVAVAANYLLMKHNMQRVLIVDFDIHHGNGTQTMFYNDHQVMYISIHKDEDGKFFPPNSPRSYKDDGHGSGKGFNMNIPFNTDKMGDTEYIAAFQNIVMPAAYAFAPQVVLVSAGFDAGINDPLGGYAVNPETFGHLILMLKPLAEGRIIMSLEGGYNLTTTSYAMTICTKALLGDPIIMPKNVYKRFSEYAIMTIRDVSKHFKKYFDIFKANKMLPVKPIIIKKVHRFTDDMYNRDLTRALDPLRVDDNDYVENEMRILNSSNH